MPVKRRRSFCAKAPLFSFTLLVLLLVISLIGLLIPPDALRQEANAIPEHVMEVKRISTNTLTDRNKIRLISNPCLELSDIQDEWLSANTPVVADYSILPDQSGVITEYVINLSGFRETSKVQATYDKVGIDPRSGRSIGCVVTFYDFDHLIHSYRGALKRAKNLPFHHSNGATEYDYPSIRISSSLSGGFWLCLLQHAKVDMQFFYDGDKDNLVDLSNAYLTIDSLDKEGDALYPDDEPFIGYEAVKPANIYDSILLTEHSKVERWGALYDALYALRYEPSNMENPCSYYYFQNDLTPLETDRPDLCVTMSGVTDGSNKFTFDIVDTQGYAHMLPRFDSIGTIDLPTPEKTIESPGPYRIGDTITWRIKQDIPARDEMRGEYTSLEIRDIFPEELRVEDINLVRLDSDEVVSIGEASGVGTNEAHYRFNMDQADQGEIYGHTYELVIDTVLDDYPANGSLSLSNAASSKCNDGDWHNSNEVEATLVPPQLSIHKQVEESPIQNDDYDDNEEGQRQEYRVGDDIGYTVTVENTEPHTAAYQVHMQDLTMPQGLRLDDAVEVEGVEAFADLRQHGATKRWGWSVLLERLASGEPVTVRWRVRSGPTINGWEIADRAEAWIGNRSGAAIQYSERPCIWINSPELVLEKRFRDGEPEQLPEAPLAYEVILHELTTPGTVARNTVLSDVLTASTASTSPSSFVITDEQGELPISGQENRERLEREVNPVELHHDQNNRHWNISMEQIYGENGYWVNSNPYTRWEDGTLVVQESSNPLGVSGPHELHVSYEATVDTSQTKPLRIENQVAADAAETEPVETSLSTVITSDAEATVPDVDVLPHKQDIPLPHHPDNPLPQQPDSPQAQLPEPPGQSKQFDTLLPGQHKKQLFSLSQREQQEQPPHESTPPQTIEPKTDSEADSKTNPNVSPGARPDTAPKRDSPMKPFDPLKDPQSPLKDPYNSQDESLDPDYEPFDPLEDPLEDQKSKKSDTLAKTGDGFTSFFMENWKPLLVLIGGSALLVLIIPLKRYLTARKRWYPF